MKVRDLPTICELPNRVPDFWFIVDDPDYETYLYNFRYEDNTIEIYRNISDVTIKLSHTCCVDELSENDLDRDIEPELMVVVK